MFGIGMPELIFIFGAALVVFGPRKLPEIGRTIGKVMGQFRSASNEFKRAWESEVDMENEFKELKNLKKSILNTETPAKSPAPAPEPSAPATPDFSDTAPADTIPFAQRPSYYGDSLAEAEIAVEQEMAAEANSTEPEPFNPTVAKPTPVPPAFEPAYHRTATAGPSLEGYEG